MKITSKIFHDEKTARKYLERIRWPDDPICPHCGVLNEATKLEGEKHRPGLYQCNACREQFSVTVGTLFERSKVPLHKWLMAAYLMNSSKKGISAKQLERNLGVTYKTAWFMAHRLREAMREHFDDQMGGNGGEAEADETFVGGRKRNAQGGKDKEKVLSLVDRSTGKVRSFHVPSVNARTLRPILRQHLAKDTHIKTDEAKHYARLRRDFASHETVNHSIHEYVRGSAHTNTLEGYFSILKRGINGVYHHVSGTHLKRYVGEFDFRYNYRQKLGYDDMERTKIALQGIAGKRLTYRTANQGWRPRAN